MMNPLEESFKESADNTVKLIEEARFPELLSIRQNILIYMVGCYFYYVLDKSIMPDKLFDAVCSYLKDNLENVKETEWFKTYLNKDALSARTGYHITQYPKFIEIICCVLNKENRSSLLK